MATSSTSSQASPGPRSLDLAPARMRGRPSLQGPGAAPALRGSAVKLRRTDQPPIYDPLVGIVRFDMENEGQVIHCMVSESALRGRAAMAGDTELDIAALFEKYRGEVENIA